MARYLNSVPTILDSNGDPIVGAKKFFFSQGTTTKKTIYSDSALGTPASNPVISDANGRFPDTFLDGLYKEEQQDNSGTATGYDGVTLWTRDPVGTVEEWPWGTWDESVIYSIPEIALGSDDEYYRSLVDSNTGNDPTLLLGNWEKLSLGRVWDNSITYTAADVVVGSNGYSYIARTSSNLANDPTTDGVNWRSLSEARLVKGADIASANDLVLLQDGNDNDITGSVDVNGMTDGIANERRHFHADAAFTLKHNTAASSGFSSFWIVQGAADITTAAGDEWDGIYDGTYWRVINYNTANDAGEVIIWPLATPKAGTLECDGSAVSRTTYAALFAVISDLYGVGDGSTTFNIPDYQGEFLRGWDNGAGNDPDAASRTDRGDGTAGDNIGTKQADELESHTHSESISSTGGTGSASETVIVGGNETTTGATGGNETRPRNVNVMYCIKY